AERGAGDEPCDETSLGRHSNLRDSPEPLQIAGLEHDLARRAEAAVGRIVDDDRCPPERAGEPLAATVVVRSDRHLVTVPFGCGDGRLLLVVRDGELDLHSGPIAWCSLSRVGSSWRARSSCGARGPRLPGGP